MIADDIEMKEECEDDKQKWAERSRESSCENEQSMERNDNTSDDESEDENELRLRSFIRRSQDNLQEISF